MDSLPREIIWLISTYLPIRDLGSFLVVGRVNGSLFGENAFWDEVVHIHAPLWRWSTEALQTVASRKGWKSAAILAHQNRQPVNLIVIPSLLKGDPFDFEINCCIVGDPGVGKSSLLVRYFFGKDPRGVEELQPANAMKVIDCVFKGEKKPLRLKVFCRDQLHGEEFISTEGLFKRFGLVFLCFDTTRMSTFERARDCWAMEIAFGLDVEDLRTINVVLVGCKQDLVYDRKVSREVAESFAIENGWRYFETSSLMDEGVTELFEVPTSLCLRSFRVYQGIGSASGRKCLMM